MTASLVRAAALVALAVAAFSTFSTSQAQTQTASGERDTAIFAGGCFWCVESDFDRVPGVLQTTSGYTGGNVDNPTYKQVTRGGTGHREAVEIVFDPRKVSYEELVEIFWRSVDPTDGGGQFCDRGHSYSTAIYATDARQLEIANASKQRLIDSGKLSETIVTPIERAKPFYAAEAYHQDFYTKSPVRYKVYRYGCGRDARIKQLWGDEAHRGIEDH